MLLVQRGVLESQEGIRQLEQVDELAQVGVGAVDGEDERALDQPVLLDLLLRIGEGARHQAGAPGEVLDLGGDAGQAPPAGGEMVVVELQDALAVDPRLAQQVFEAQALGARPFQPGCLVALVELQGLDAIGVADAIDQQPHAVDRQEGQRGDPHPQALPPDVAPRAGHGRSPRRGGGVTRTRPAPAGERGAGAPGSPPLPALGAAARARRAAGRVSAAWVAGRLG